MQDEARELDGEKVMLAAELRDEERTSEYFLVLQQLERTRGDVRRVIQRPENCLPYIQVRGSLLAPCVRFNNTKFRLVILLICSGRCVRGIFIVPDGRGWRMAGSQHGVPTIEGVMTKPD